MPSAIRANNVMVVQYISLVSVSCDIMYYIVYLGETAQVLYASEILIARSFMGSIILSLMTRRARWF